VTSGDGHAVTRRSGRVEDIMQEKNEERYVVIEVRPEGCTHGPCLDITLNRWDMRSKFGIQRYVKFGFNRLDFRNLWMGY